MVIDPSVYAYPYVMLLIICLLVLAAVFWRYPPLRVYRRKRNILVYGVLALVFSLLAYQAYAVSLGPNFISFGIQKTVTPIYPGQENHFSVTCYSDGAKEVGFYMVFQCENATLQVDGESSYIQTNATAIKIPFSFHGNGEQTKVVYFTADSNVASLSFYPSVERQKGEGDFIVTAWLTEISCTWDPVTCSFAMADSPPIAVP
jgi:hypothetical protein